MTVDEWLIRIDSEIHGWEADRESHLTDASIDGMIVVGKLPEQAREFFNKKD